MDKVLTAAIVAAAQLELSRKGFCTGEIDGIVGPRTAAAFIAFKARHGWRARATPLLQTLPLLFSKEGLCRR